MSSKDNIRIIIHDPQQKQCVLTIERKGDGDLVFGLRTASFLEADYENLPSADEFQDLFNEKYSIHTSPKSEHQANLIKRESIPKEGPTITGVQYTTAIKKDNQFAVVFVRRCPTLLHPASKIKKQNPNELMLGSFTPDSFALFFAIIVGPKDRVFNDSERGLDINVVQLQANDFDVVVLWSFLSVPAHNIGEILHVESEKIEDKTFQNGNLSTIGMNEIECYEYFRSARVVLYSNLVQLLHNEPKWDKKKFSDHLYKAVFYRQGNGTPTYRHIYSSQYRHTILNSPVLAIESDCINLEIIKSNQV